MNKDKDLNHLWKNKVQEGLEKSNKNNSQSKQWDKSVCIEYVSELLITKFDECFCGDGFHKGNDFSVIGRAFRGFEFWEKML